MSKQAAADELRAWVVKRIVMAIISLTFLLHLAVVLLIWRRGDQSVPSALWAASGLGLGSLTTWLVNSKQAPETVEVAPAPSD